MAHITKQHKLHTTSQRHVERTATQRLALQPLVSKVQVLQGQAARRPGQASWGPKHMATCVATWSAGIFLDERPGNARKNTPATRSSSSWTHRARRTSSPSTRAPGFLTLQARATSPCRPTLVRLEMAQHQPRTPGSDARLSHFLSAGHVQATLRQRV